MATTNNQKGEIKEKNTKRSTTSVAARTSTTKKVAAKKTTAKKSSAAVTGAPVKRSPGRPKKTEATANVKGTSTKKAGTKKTTSNKATTSKKPASAKKTSSTPKKKVVETVKVEKDEPIVVEQEKKIEPEQVEIVEKAKKGNSSVPKSILGLDLPEGMDPVDKKARHKLYAKDALMFSIIIPIFDLLAMLFIDAYKPLLLTNNTVANYIVTLLLDFILIFAVTYLIDFVFGEDAIKKNNK